MSIFLFKPDGYDYRVNRHIILCFCLSYVLSYHTVRQLTSVWYSGVGFRISNPNFTVPWYHDMGRVCPSAGYEQQPVITGHPPRKWRCKIVTAQVSVQVRLPR